MRTKTFQDYKDQAIELWNKGFSSKVSKKNALGKVNDSYEVLRETIMDGVRSFPEEMWNSPEYNELYWTIPSYPHQWNEKCRNLYNDRFPSEVKEIEFLVELRTSIKETEVVPPVKIETPEQIKANKVEKTIEEIMERLEVRFLEGYSLAEEFGGLSVSAWSHYGRNQHGTEFIRTFYYLFGKVTALNTICAIHCKHKDEHPELYPDEEVA